MEPAYEADSETQAAVERNLQIVGDAAHKLSAKLKRRTPTSRGRRLRRAEHGCPLLFRREREDPLGHPSERPRPLLKKVPELLGRGA